MIIIMLVYNIVTIECLFMLVYNGVARKFATRGKQWCSEDFWRPEPIVLYFLAPLWRPLATGVRSGYRLHPARPLLVYGGIMMVYGGISWHIRMRV